MSKIKTFRGLLNDLQQDRIYLAGGEVDKGYKITKFELIAAAPASQDSVNIVKITTTKQSTPTAAIDFNDDSLLAAGVMQSTSSYAYGEYTAVVFDQVVVNQDIFIANKDYATGEGVNYYLELEEFKMKDPEIAVVNYRAALLHGE